MIRQRQLVRVPNHVHVRHGTVNVVVHRVRVKP